MERLQSALEDVFSAIKKIADSQADSQVDNMLSIQMDLLEVTGWLKKVARGLTVAIIDVATQKINTDEHITKSD